jgi:hypothetical protein
MRALQKIMHSASAELSFYGLRNRVSSLARWRQIPQS